MDLTTIEDALATIPFEPLRIHLASGTFCDIRHPDSAFVHRGQLLIIDRVDPGARTINAYHFLDPQLIKSVLPLRLVPPESPADELSDREIILPAARALDWVESLLALLATFLICAIVAFSGISLYLGAGKGPLINDIVSLSVWAVLIGIEIVLLLRIVRFYNKRLYPLALLYALANEPPSHAAGRLALAAFWLTHGLAGISAFAYLQSFFVENSLRRSSVDRWFEEAILVLLVSAGAHASMMFFLLAARAAGGTPRILRRLWRFRIVLDAAVVSTVLLSPTWLPHLLRPLVMLLRNLRYLLG